MTPEKQRFARLVALYTQALEADVLDAALVPEIDAVFAEIAAELGETFTPPKKVAVQESGTYESVAEMQDVARIQIYNFLMRELLDGRTVKFMIFKMGTMGEYKVFTFLPDAVDLIRPTKTAFEIYVQLNDWTGWHQPVEGYAKKENGKVVWDGTLVLSTSGNEWRYEDKTHQKFETPFYKKHIKPFANSFGRLDYSKMWDAFESAKKDGKDDLFLRYVEAHFPSLEFGKAWRKQTELVSAKNAESNWSKVNTFSIRVENHNATVVWDEKPKATPLPSPHPRHDAAMVAAGLGEDYVPPENRITKDVRPTNKRKTAPRKVTYTAKPAPAPAPAKPTPEPADPRTKAWRGYNLPATIGDKTDVLFTADGAEKVSGEYQVIGVDFLIASHHPDCSRNTAHEISDAQPRDRSAKELCAQSDFMASKMNPQIINDLTPMAFTGPPVVNDDYMVIQGNGRAIALTTMYKAYPDSAFAYKMYLLDNAAKYGFKRDDIAQIRNPVLVRVLDVPNTEAARLGNIVDRSQAKQTTSDETKAAARLLTKEARSRIGKIMAESTGETLGEVIDEKGMAIFRLMPNTDSIGLVRDGNLTGEGKDYLIRFFEALIFDNKDGSGLKAYNALPYKTKQGLSKAIAYLVPFVSTPYDLSKDLQEAVLLIAEQQRRSDAFPSVRLYLTSGDFELGYVQDRYSERAQQLAKALDEAKTQKEVGQLFAKYDHLANPQQANLYEPYRDAFTPEEAFVMAFAPVKPGKAEPRRVNGRPVSRDGHYAFLGFAERLTIETPQGVDQLDGFDYMFTDPTGTTLIIVPSQYVRETELPTHKAAGKMFKKWQHDAPSGKGFEITLPQVKKETQIGHASAIWYASDKLMQSSDTRGKLNGYVHQFDAGKRPVYKRGPALIIRNLKINGRGILN